MPAAGNIRKLRVHPSPIFFVIARHPSAMWIEMFRRYLKSICCIMYNYLCIFVCLFAVCTYCCKLLDVAVIRNRCTSTYRKVTSLQYRNHLPVVVLHLWVFPTFLFSFVQTQSCPMHKSAQREQHLPNPWVPSFFLRFQGSTGGRGTWPTAAWSGGRMRPLDRWVQRWRLAPRFEKFDHFRVKKRGEEQTMVWR